MEKQNDSLKVKKGKKMDGIDESHWFNFSYKVRTELGDNRGTYDAIMRGVAVPHPVSMKMTLEQYLEAEEKLRTSCKFLELEAHKLESPQYSIESVKRANYFAAAFGGIKTSTIPDATTDMGFGEMYLKVYVCKDKIGTITLKSSTENKYANEISLYGFTEEGFKKVVGGLCLPI